MDVTSLPTDRRGRARWLANREEEVAALTRTELDRIVTEALDTFAAGLTASVDFAPFDPIPSRWLTFVSTTLADEMGDTHLAGYMTAWLGLPSQPTDAFARQFAAVANDAAVSYVRDATNRLSRVGDETWRLVRAKVQQAVQQGLTVPELRDEVQQVAGFTRARAETIARTEVIGAYVQGDMAGNRALGAQGPVEKVWVATRDARTRPTHAEAHDQVRPMGAPFSVGGTSLDSPHDPSAPAGEVVNCRCYVEFLYPGDARPDGTLVPATAAGPAEEAAPAAPAPQRAPRAPRYARVDEAAARHGVSRAQVLSYMPDVPAAKATIGRAAAEAQATSLQFLDAFDGLKLRRPGRGAARGAEYDWLERLDPAERSRLSRWWSDDRSAAIDVVLHRAVEQGFLSPGTTIDEFAELWLDHNRRIDLGSSIRAGRVSNPARFGGLDADDLLPDGGGTGWKAARIMGEDPRDVAAYLARHAADEAEDHAWRVLAPDQIEGTPPWRMSFQSWEEEVRTIEFRAQEGTATRQELGRYRELVPRGIDNGQDYELLYAETIETARIARLEVADWATIPWADGLAVG